MNRKPDMMITLVIIFCVGLVISGFTTFSYTKEKPATVLLSSLQLPASDSEQARN